MAKNGPNTNVLPDQPTNAEILEAILKQTEAIQKQTDALQEITKTVATLNTEWAKWRKAGKF